MQAIILCGGKGERLRPLTDNTPKPLVEVNGAPIISHIIKHLNFYNITDIILATGYMSESFENFFDKTSYKPTLIDTGDKDIIERLIHAEGLIDSDFLVLYGDTISDINVSNLVKFHYAHEKIATMSAWPLETQFGLVEIDDDHNVKGFQEKPRLDKWINIGYFCFKKEIFTYLKKYKSFEDFLYGITNDNLLTAFKHEGIHLTINTMQELENAEEKISSISTI